MKLYTEAQVLNMLNMTDEVVNGDLYTYDEIIKSQIPIELPSDEEIEEESQNKTRVDFGYYLRITWVEGAKWMKEKILKQIKIKEMEKTGIEQEGEVNIPEPQVHRALTFGEKLVGLTFNPSGDSKVHRAKELCAELANLLHDHYRSKESYPLEQTLYNHAMGEILNAQMNVVKVLTYQE